MKGDQLCQEQKDKPGERSVKQDALRVAQHASRAARDDELRVRNVAPGEGLREASAAQHAKLLAVPGARVAG
ncbi:MAG: hypothetical protein ACM3NN_16195 [Nitrospirota bacterium]